MGLASVSASSFGNIMVVSGWRGVGKTTFCHREAERYRAAGWKCAGLLSPGRFANGVKTGITTLDMASGDSRLLASLEEGEIAGESFGPWTFDPAVFEWGNQQLSGLVDTDLLVIDELGPLEFQRQAGWSAAFKLLERKTFRLALVVIRPECVQKFSRMGFTFEVREISLPRE